MDPEETKEMQEGRIEYFKRKGDQQFTKNGRRAQITIDLVLQARAKMSENRVNGPEDAVVSEITSREHLHHHKVPPGTLHGSDGGTTFMKDRETSVFYEKPDAEPKKNNKKLQSCCTDVGDVDMMRGVYYSSFEQRRGTRRLETVKCGELDGISCQHLQVMLTQVLQKTLGVARGRKTHDEARQCDTTTHVFGKHGHEDGVRCGRTEARGNNYG